MLLLSGTVSLKTFDILYLRRHILIWHTQQIIIFSLSPHLSFIQSIRPVSSPIIPSLVSLHLYIVGSLVHSNWLCSPFTSLIISETLLSSHVICYAAYYCSIVSAIKPPSRFHPCLVGFYRHSKSPHSSSLLLYHLISSFVNILYQSHFIL